MLEDQLYEADYHNRVLRDDLRRARIEASEVQIHAASPAQGKSSQDLSPPPIQPSPDPRSDSGNSVVEESKPESSEEFNLDDLMPPVLDEGEPIDPKALKTLDDDVDGGVSSPSSADSSEQAKPSFVPPTLPGSDPPKSDSPIKAPSLEDSDSKKPLEPAPGGPVPPGKSDTEIPPILPGETLPPGNDSDSAKPPGQILLPDSVNAVDRIPDTLRIHQGLSGGHRVDGQIRDMMLVVNVVNHLGKTIKLEDFQVAAELSVVILDPKREPSEARIGRWNFDREEVIALVKKEPISGFHIPINWHEFQPKGDEVIVHVRLRAEEDEMRCEGTVRVEKQPAIAEWTPRGESRR